MSLSHTFSIIDAFAGVLTEETAKEVVAYRSRMGRRYALTERSAKMLARQLARCPDPDAAAEEMIVRGWQSIKPEWLKPEKQSTGNPMMDAMAGFEWPARH
ncbi:hypothetical protein QBK99_11115 [Corticibacterium sp. UT-5YL-CI-8]|nr:hypothetical protein [Tianweitania sp. UT-5YL-CI-8]